MRSAPRGLEEQLSVSGLAKFCAPCRYRAAVEVHRKPITLPPRPGGDCHESGGNDPNNRQSVKKRRLLAVCRGRKHHLAALARPLPSKCPAQVARASGAGGSRPSAMFAAATRQLGISGLVAAL